jgi:hypothetical protein
MVRQSISCSNPLHPRQIRARPRVLVLGYGIEKCTRSWQRAVVLRVVMASGVVDEVEIAPIDCEDDGNMLKTPDAEAK